MANRHPILVCCIFFAAILFTSQVNAQAGQVSLFADASCNKPSTTLPKISVELSTCIIPVGAYGLVINSYPACSGGRTASMIMYKDTICAQSDEGGLLNKCFRYFPSFTIPSLMFTCDDPASNPQPTNTFTATATRLAGLASSTQSSSNTTPFSATTMTTAISGGSSTTQASQTTTGTSPSVTDNSSSSKPSSGGGLSTSDKIAIGVGLGVGIPTMIFGLIQCLKSMGCL